jgi:hypothetical protein
MNRFRTQWLLILPVLVIFMASTNFEELDKPPEGAHKGQILTGASILFGQPAGPVIDAESAFLENSTYTFQESDITKEVLVSHLSFSALLFGEYMPLDYMGLRCGAGFLSVIQRSQFGSEFRNWRGTLLSGYFFQCGPVLHVTNRQPWDITLHPFAGYGYYTAHAVPVADQLYNDFDPDNKHSYLSMHYGVELAFAFYFSGGFFFSTGISYTRNNFSTGKPLDRNNPQTNKAYFDGQSSGPIHNFLLSISAGYAFDH